MKMKAGQIALATLALPLVWGGSLQAAEPPMAGTVSVEAAADDTSMNPALPAFAKAVGEAFETKGFTVLEQPGHAAFVVEIRLRREEVGTGRAKVETSGASVMGGAPNSVGLGVRVPLPTGKSTLVPLERTRLEIQVHKRGENAAAWQGAAITVRGAGTKRGADAVVAADLSAALLRAYPNQPEDVIGVP